MTSGHDVADARLHREVAALHRAGVTVEVLGLGRESAGPPEARTRTWTRGGGLRRAWFALTFPLRAQGEVLVALDPDSAAGVRLTRVLRRATGRRTVLVTDVHENYALLLQDRAWASGLRGWGAAVWARMGLAAARHADLLVVADEHLMTEEPGRLVLRNLADVTMLPGPAQADPEPRALYIGDLRRSRGLFAMLDAVAAAPGWRLDLVGPLAPSDREAMLARIAQPDLDGRVHFHGRQPPREAWTVATGAWVGLLMLEDTPAFRDAIPSKLFEYLACGLAVVSTDLPRSAELVRRTGAGVVVADAAGAADAMRAWADDPASLEPLRAGARAAAAHITDGEELAAFAAAVRALLVTTEAPATSGH